MSCALWYAAVGGGVVIACAVAGATGALWTRRQPGRRDRPDRRADRRDADDRRP
jgi:hypothetical protein